MVSSPPKWCQPGHSAFPSCLIGVHTVQNIGPEELGRLSLGIGSPSGGAGPGAGANIRPILKRMQAAAEQAAIFPLHRGNDISSHVFPCFAKVIVLSFYDVMLLYLPCLETPKSRRTPARVSISRTSVGIPLAGPAALISALLELYMLDT